MTVLSYAVSWIYHVGKNELISFIAIFTNSLNVGILGNSETREDNGKTLFFTHGHLYDNYHLPPILKEGDIFFYGHYHFPDISINHGVYCVCVGSMGRPRAGSDQSYCVYENGVIRLISAEKDTVLVEIDTNKN